MDVVLVDVVDFYRRCSLGPIPVLPAGLLLKGAPHMAHTLPDLPHGHNQPPKFVEMLCLALYGFSNIALHRSWSMNKNNPSVSSEVAVYCS